MVADPTSDTESHKTIESNVSNQIVGQENESNMEYDKQGRNQFGNGVGILIRSDCFDIFLKVLYVLLCIPWLISIVFFSIFDTKCVVLEQASTVNCSQEFFVSNPTYWIFAWLLMSIISSFLLMLIVRLNHKKLNYQTEKAKKTFKKGHVGSLIILLLISMVYNAVRISTTSSEKTSFSISILIFLWLPVIVLVICCLNYLPRVQWSKTCHSRFTLIWWKNCLIKNSNFIIYWLALTVHFVEVTSVVASIMLDVALEVSPLFQRNSSSESSKFRGLVVIMLGFRLSFHLRVLSFFWEKLFHGEKDLFSEPSDKLVDEPLKQHDELEKTVQLKKIVFA